MPAFTVILLLGKVRCSSNANCLCCVSDFITNPITTIVEVILSGETFEGNHHISNLLLALI